MLSWRRLTRRFRCTLIELLQETVSYVIFRSHNLVGFANQRADAGVAELVDAPDLGSGAFGVGVRVPSPAPQKNPQYIEKPAPSFASVTQVLATLGGMLKGHSVRMI